MENLAQFIYAAAQITLYVLLCVLIGMFVIRGLKKKKPKTKLFYAIFSGMNDNGDLGPRVPFREARTRLVPSDSTTHDLKEWIKEQQDKLAIDHQVEPGDVFFTEIRVIKV